jgi:hypothetical protein
VKKLGIVLGVLIGLFVAAALMIPLVVNVDQYRPQIVEAANQQINGKLELGKLKLSLWGQIRIEVGGLKLSDLKGTDVVTVKDAYFHLPFLSVLSGSPRLTFYMKQPRVNVIKDRNGKLNVMSLMKESPKEATPKTPPSQTSPSAPSDKEEGGMPALPGIATRARLGVELRNAQVIYQDETSGLSTDVKDLNLILRDISLSRPTELELWANLDTQLGRTFMLRGPARLTGKAQPTLKDRKIEHVSLTAHLDMDAVEMIAPGSFEKKKDIPTRVDLTVSASEKEAKIENFSAQFFNAELHAEGTITNLESTASGASPVVHLTVKSNEIQFGPWVGLIPLLKAYELGGSARFDAEVNGPSQKLGYRGKLAFNGITAKAPQLKVQPKLDGLVSVLTDQIDDFWVTLKAPANDLKIQGKLVSFSKPRLDAQVTSSGMDLDQLLVFPSPAQKAQATGGVPASGTPEKKEAKTVPEDDVDAMLDPLRENKILGNFIANIGINMKMIQARNVKVSEILCQLSFKELVAGMDQCGLKVFKGVVKADAHVQMRPKAPTYQFNTSVVGLDMAQAVDSQMALFKHTVTGKAHFKLNGQGASFNSSPATSHLKAHGNLKVEQAQFLTVDVMKMVKEALDKSVAQIGDKIPGAKGKIPSITVPSAASKYEFISTDFSIANGKLNAPNFYAKAAPNQGIDLKGSTTVGLKDYSLNASWEVIDTYNVTHAKDISLEQNGVKIEHVLAEGNSPVRFPVQASCTIMAPCYSYTAVPEALTKVALNNVSKALTGKGKEELRKHAEAALKNAPPALREQLKGFFR